MYNRILILFTAFLYYSGMVNVARWWVRRSKDCVIILNYHRASGGDLRSHLLYLRRYYRILHLETALQELYMPSKRNSAPKDQRTSLVLTFDDGYHDNYTHAFVLSRELQVPLTIFLVPGYIESGSCFWWFEGEQLVTHAQVHKATIEGCTYHLDQLDERYALAQAIDTRVRHASSVKEREEYLAAVRQILEASPSVFNEEEATLPLTWTEVQEMEESEWVSFGAHTVHHPILAYLADAAELQYEVGECRALLEQHLKHPVRIFAYPVGKHNHIGENAVRAVQEAKYTWALTTLYGVNTPPSDPYLLRRLEVDADQHWLIIAAKTSGLWNFFFQLYRHSITFARTYFRVPSTSLRRKMETACGAGSRGMLGGK